ncbi:MAG: His/Gly/Thr/Pro-type tRNA ligase C-terminal domain-containing protein, partial [Bacilli bacterium]|nr:His/Gly/Thr/Pro-type tRNA ligase C-terminal domain-containing protein [Bacilli bacterium]
ALPISYIDDKGEKVQPIMLHRACLGSLERFIGILIEHYAGAFPVWLAPLQINVLPVNNQYHLDYAKEVCAISKENDLRINLDDSEEKLGYRLRNSQVKKIPLTIVIGDNEVEKRTVTYRRYGQKDQVTISLDEFIEMVKKEIDQKIAF